MRKAWYFVREAISNLVRNKVVNTIAIGTIAMAITLLSVFALLFVNAHLLLQKLGNQFQVVIYVRDDLTDEDREGIRTFLAHQVGLTVEKYISKEEALVDFKRRLGSHQTILDGLEANPLPASFVVKVEEAQRTSEQMVALAEELSQLKGIEEVEYGSGWLERFEMFVRVMRLLIILVGGLLALAVIFIISNTIKLALYSRLEEVEIMKLVGATEWFIRIPFLIEGMIQGVLGVLLALLSLFLLHHFLLLPFRDSAPLFLGLRSLSLLSQRLVIALLTGGILLGYIGSLISTRRFLKV